MDNDFPERIKRQLAARAGHVCSNPVCLQPTSGPSDSQKLVTSVGEAAHIAGARPGSARYDTAMTAEQRRALENGIWLCSKCAKLVDDDPDHYSVALLERWKKAAEDLAREKIEKGVVSAPKSTLAPEAMDLLVAGAGDPQGTIFAVTYLSGFDVSVGDRKFVEFPNPRDEAKWKAVIRELAKAQLIEPAGPKGEWYTLTELGYQLADELRGTA